MKTKKFINWRAVSEHLTGHPDQIRSNRIGDKYEDQINELLRDVENWQAKTKK